MLTTQSLPTPPLGSGSRPEFAPLMRSPSISTGPRMYFALPSCSQVTNAFFGSPGTPPVRLAGSVQSSASKSAWTFGVT